MSDGRSIPQFGLGVYEMTDDETRNATKWALEAGYIHIDTAEWWVTSILLTVGTRTRARSGRG